MRGPLCLLAHLVPGDRPAVLAAHRGECLRCRGEAARDTALRADLAALADDLVPAPRGLRSQVLASLGEQDAADPRRDLVARMAARYAAAAGLGVATLLALAAGLARRHSRALG
jgi:hypothetical protein